MQQQFGDYKWRLYGRKKPLCEHRKASPRYSHLGIKPKLKLYYVNTLSKNQRSPLTRCSKNWGSVAEECRFQVLLIHSGILAQAMYTKIRNMVKLCYITVQTKFWEAWIHISLSKWRRVFGRDIRAGDLERVQTPPHSIRACPRSRWIEPSGVSNANTSRRDPA
jgi:hypothetical protein